MVLVAWLSRCPLCRKVPPELPWVLATHVFPTAAEGLTATATTRAQGEERVTSSEPGTSEL